MKFNINAVNCNSILKGTCPCCFVCVFFYSFLCSISLLLLSGSLSYTLNSYYKCDYVYIYRERESTASVILEMLRQAILFTC